MLLYGIIVFVSGRNMGHIWLITNFKGQEVCVLSTASRLAQGSNKPAVKLVPGALSLGLKWPGRETQFHLVRKSQMVDLYNSSTSRFHGLVLN
jgi:hypothetical protein